MRDPRSYCENDCVACESVRCFLLFCISGGDVHLMPSILFPFLFSCFAYYVVLVQCIARYEKKREQRLGAEEKKCIKAECKEKVLDAKIEAKHIKRCMDKLA